MRESNVRGSPGRMSLSARRCHFARSAEERSNATFGSQEWFTGHLSVGARGAGTREGGRTIHEVAVKLDVVVRATAALHGRVRLRAVRQAPESTQHLARGECLGAR